MLRAAWRVGAGRGLLTPALNVTRRWLCVASEAAPASASGGQASEAAVTGAALPFRVLRSSRGNLPIYTDIRNGGTRIVTILRKYTGDTDALRDEVQRQCDGAKVTLYHGRMEVKGRHRKRISEWLTGLGF